MNTRGGVALIKTGAVYPGFRHRQNCERPQLGIGPSTDRAVKNCNQCWTRKVSVPLKEKAKFTRQVKSKF